MPFYRDLDACGRADELTVIEDAAMVVIDPNGDRHPGFRFIEPNTIRAHPLIIDVLLEHAEPLWSLEEILGEDGPRPG